MKRKTYSEELKASVMAALMQGQSISSVAKEYNIPKGTVSGWKNQTQGVASLSTQKKDQIGDLLLTYLAASLETLHTQVKVFADEEWLKEQSASEVAVLHGVIADKSIRLLEALSGAEEEAQEED